MDTGEVKEKGSIKNECSQSLFYQPFLEFCERHDASREGGEKVKIRNRNKEGSRI
jgi:hypothetical protein